MRDEFDFRKDVRHRFCRTGIERIPPTHQSRELLDCPSECAKAKDANLNSSVKSILRKSIGLAGSAR